MAQTLDETKDRLRDAYLGRAGIHGFGVRRAENAVCVYLQPQQTPEQEEVLREVEAQAAPFGVIPVFEQAPRLA